MYNPANLHHDRHRRRIGDGGIPRHKPLLADHRRKIPRRQHQSPLAPRLLRLLQRLYRLGDALRRRPRDERVVLEPGFLQLLSQVRQEGRALRIGDHDRFAGRAEHDETADAAFGEVDGVLGLGGEVEGRGECVVVRSGGGDEEGGHGHVDAFGWRCCWHDCSMSKLEVVSIHHQRYVVSPSPHFSDLLAHWLMIVMHPSRNALSRGLMSGERRPNLGVRTVNSIHTTLFIREIAKSILTESMAVGLLEGKVSAITGGLTGIGRAIALQYLQEGAKVAINYFGGPSDEALLEKLRTEVAGNSSCFIAVAGDISKPETGQQLVRETVAAFGRLDIFVSNAGICQFAEFLE